MNKRAQLTIFVVLALAIVAIMIVLLYPRVKEYVAGVPPGDMVPKECVMKSVFSALNETMMRGGELKPKLYFMYNNYTVGYVCYTSDWYKTCVMQKPFLKESAQAEVNKVIQSKVKVCFDQMETSLKSKGYTVTSSGSKESSINIIPDKINFSIDLKINLERNDEQFAFDSNKFKFNFPSKSYDLFIIASSIQNYEARYGDAAPEVYMSYYPFIKVEKKKFDDGTKVYILTQRNTGEMLQFATRSLAWPPGWALTPQFSSGTGA